MFVLPLFVLVHREDPLLRRLTSALLVLLARYPASWELLLSWCRIHWCKGQGWQETEHPQGVGWYRHGPRSAWCCWSHCNKSPQAHSAILLPCPAGDRVHDPDPDRRTALPESRSGKESRLAQITSL